VHPNPAPRSDPPAPDVIADLNRDWFASILDAPVASIDVEPLGASVGLLCDLVRVHLHYGAAATTVDQPDSVIVKFPTTDPAGHQIGSMLRAWDREVAFYLNVAPLSVGAKVPRCHFAGTSADDAAPVVVLSDLRTDAVNAVDGATRAQAEAAVSALAGFHARWWEADDRFEWMPGFDATGVGGLSQAWQASIDHFLHRFSALIPPPADQWIRSFAPRLGQWSDRAGTEPLTVVHADYQLDNLLFSGDDVTIVDWQTALRGPGAMDLTSFILTALPIDRRRDWEDDLISRYLDELAGHGVTVDRDWFCRSYDENILWWMGQFGHNLAHLEPADPATQRRLDSMIERTYTAAVDRDVGRLL